MEDRAFREWGWLVVLALVVLAVAVTVGPLVVEILSRLAEFIQALGGM